MSDHDIMCRLVKKIEDLTIQVKYLQREIEEQEYDLFNIGHDVSWIKENINEKENLHI